MTLLGTRFEVDAVIVDLDGTMVDTLGDFVVALNLMLADLPALYRSHQVDRATVARLVGKGSEHLLTSVLALAGAPVSDLETVYAQAWPSYQRHYLAINGQHSTVYPGVIPGLLRLRAQGLKLACLTNKPTALALPLLRAKGLAHFFELDPFPKRIQD